MNDPDRDSIVSSAFSTVVALAYGLLMLGFLVAIDHGEWLQIKPASGTAQALSLAADREPES
jgi:hypothetical protein